MARRLHRQPGGDGVYRLDEGAVLDDCVHCLHSRGEMAVLAQACGAAIHRAMVPFVQDVLRYGLKTLFGMECINALSSLLCRDEVRMQLVGFNGPQVRHGVCQCGETTRQGERAPRPRCPDTLGKNIVKWHLRDLEMVFNGAMRALAKAGVVGATIMGMADGTDLDTTARYTGCGEVTRTVCIEDRRGKVHEIEVTVYGWKVLLLMDAVTKSPLAVNVGQIQAHAALWARALVPPTRMNLAGDARLATGGFDQSFGDGTTRWGLDQ